MMKLFSRSLLLGSLALLAACSSGLQSAPPSLELEAQATSTTVTIPIATAADDIEESPLGTMLTGKALDFSQNNQKVGLRFAAAVIPQGATITSASIGFTALASDSGALNLSVKAQASDSAAAFTTTSKNLSSRPLTAASAVWQPNAWTVGQATRTADLAAVVQEVVSRSGWKSGNALAFVVTGDSASKRSAAARDKDAVSAPVLTITYEIADAPVVPEVPTVPTPTPGSHSVTVKTAAAADDFEESPLGTMLAGNALDFSQNNQKVGLRFAGLSIPQGAVIKSASVSLKALVADSGAVTLTFKGEDADSASPFTTTSKNLSSRILTTASAAWQPSVWTVGQSYRSAELTSVVQEVVSRSGWQSGNALALIVTGNSASKRSASARDRNEADAPVLTITYDLPVLPEEPEEPTVPSEPGTPTIPALPPVASCLSSSGGLRLTLTGDRTTYYAVGNKTDPKVSAWGSSVTYSGLAFISTKNLNSFCLSGGTYKSALASSATWSEFHNTAAVYLESTPNATVEGAVVMNAGDGFSIKNNSPNWVVRGSYGNDLRDDAFENDRFNTATIEDNLIDNAFTAFSCREEANRVAPRNTPVTMQNNLIALKTQANGGSHNDLFKWTLYKTEGCQLTLKNNIFLLTNKNAGHINPEKDPRVQNDALNEAACVGNKNIVVFVGNDPTYLAQLRAASPECFEVTTDIGVWNKARGEWFDRHPQFSQYR